MLIFRLKQSLTCLNIAHLHSALDPTVIDVANSVHSFGPFPSLTNPPIEGRYKIA